MEDEFPIGFILKEVSLVKDQKFGGDEQRFHPAISFIAEGSVLKVFRYQQITHDSSSTKSGFRTHFLVNPHHHSRDVPPERLYD